MLLNRKCLAVALVCVVAGGLTGLAAEPKTSPNLPKIKIVLVGDSTVTDASGWGRGFAPVLQPAAQCFNWAKGGRSSRSFIAEGWWKKALAEKPDYVLIQFGHNDQPGKGPKRETDPKTAFPAQIGRYVDEARAAGAKPILVTSLTRRHFGPDNKIASTLQPYADAVKRVAAEKKVPLIDLHTQSIALHNQLGPVASRKFNYVNPAKPTDAIDLTHLSPEGAKVIGRMVADDLKQAVPELAPYIQ